MFRKSFPVNRQGLEKMEREKQKTAEKKQPREDSDFNSRREIKIEKLSPRQFSKFVSSDTCWLTFRMIHDPIFNF